MHTEEMLHGRMEPRGDAREGQWERDRVACSQLSGHWPAISLGVALFLVCVPWLRAHTPSFSTPKKELAWLGKTSLLNCRLSRAVV